MSSHNANNPLSDYQQNICTYGGVFGILLTATCLIQHFSVVIRHNWITNSIVSAYFLIIMAFILLTMLRTIAPVLLIVTGVLSLAIQFLWMKSLSFSLTVLMLFIYHVIIVVMLYTEQVPKRLKEKRRMEIDEEARWAGKL